MARAYWRLKGQPQKTKLIGRARSYHGVNLGGTSLGGIGPNRKLYGQLIDADHLPHTVLPENAFSRGEPEKGAELADALEDLIALHDASNIAAVILEPMAGSAGVLPPPKGYLQRLRTLCDAHDILLIFDEVITGFGRLGEPFRRRLFRCDAGHHESGEDSHQRQRAHGGGARPTRASIETFMENGGPDYAIEFPHGYTYSAHPLACAAALAALDIFETGRHGGEGAGPGTAFRKLPCTVSSSCPSSPTSAIWAWPGPFRSSPIPVSRPGVHSSSPWRSGRRASTCVAAAIRCSSRHPTSRPRTRSTAFSQRRQRCSKPQPERGLASRWRSLDAPDICSLSGSTMPLSVSAPHLSAALSFLFLVIAGVSALAKYDDTVFLKNGDRLSGDIKELNRDMLRYKTDSMGTIYVRWDDIQSIETEKYLRIELKNGRRLVGRLGRADAPEQLVIATRSEDERHHFDELVAFVPLKLTKAWIDRIEGAVRFGLNGTKGSDTLQWNLGANALYRGEDWEISSRWDSTTTDKSDDTTTQRINFVNAYRKLLTRGWYWNLVLGYDKNDELGINDRWSAGGGIGQFLIRSNLFELMWQGGLIASREFRTDDVSNQLEAYAGAGFAWFQHRFPKTDIRTDVLVFPSLTDSGRVRTNWDVSVAREIIEDLSLDLSVYYTTDNRPPDEASQDDWGIVTSIEYTF